MILTESQFAKAVGASVATVRRERYAGRSSYRRIGRKIFYLESDVEAWLDRAKRDPWSDRKAQLREIA